MISTSYRVNDAAGPVQMSTFVIWDIRRTTVNRDWFLVIDFAIVVAQKQKDVSEVDSGNAYDDEHNVVDTDETNQLAKSDRRDAPCHENAHLYQGNSGHASFGGRPVGNVREAGHAHCGEGSAAAVQEVSNEEVDDRGASANDCVCYHALGDCSKQRRQNGDSVQSMFSV